MSNRRPRLISGSSRGAVKSLLAPILRSEAAQEHVVLARDMSNHKKSTERGSSANQRYCIKLTIFIMPADCIYGLCWDLMIKSDKLCNKVRSPCQLVDGSPPLLIFLTESALSKGVDGGGGTSALPPPHFLSNNNDVIL